MNPFHFLEFPQTEKLFQILQDDNDIEARFVGGCVRDSLFDRNRKGNGPKDLDLAVKSDLSTLLSVLSRYDDVKVIPTGLKYGSITVIIDSLKFELTILRKDVKCEGRSCQIEENSDFKDDAQRRDFTMNALYLSRSRELFDYFGGIEDLRNSRVIFIGNPRDRIKEDYLRILRYYRFATKFRDFSDRYSQVIQEEASNISKLSIERVQNELLRILSIPNNREIFFRIKRNGVFKDLDLEGYSKVPDDASIYLKSYILFGVDSLLHTFKLPKDFRNKVRLFKQFENETLDFAHYKNGKNFADEMRMIKAILYNSLERERWNIQDCRPFPLSFQDLPQNTPFASRRLKACERWWVNQGGNGSLDECLKFVETNSDF